MRTLGIRCGRTEINVRPSAAMAVALVACLLFSASRTSAQSAPLVLEKSMAIPGTPLWAYSDYLAVDLVGKRLFATPGLAHAIAVLDLQDGHLLKMIPGVGTAHGIFYSSGLRRLFVADGDSGDVKVFDGGNYVLIKTIPLAKGADWLFYDPQSRLIFVNNGGDDAGMDHAAISVIDAASMEKIGDIPVATAALEASVVDSERQLLYVNLVDDAKVEVIDLKTREPVGLWSLPAGGHRNLAIALDAARRRIYVACRDSAMHGSIIVLDAGSGRAVATLPIGGMADGISIDQKRHRIYVSTGVGHIETYSIKGHDVYRHEALVDTAVMAKTSLFSSELDRLFVAVPHLGIGDAQVLAFRPAP